MNKNKSARYPSVNLEEAIEIIRKARSFGRSVTDAQLAGKQSIISGSFLRKKASLGYYGLISGRKGSMEVTSLADRITNPLDNGEKKDALKEAFLTPQLFKSIYDKVEPNEPINLDTLSNLSVRNYGIQPKAQKHFMDVFVESGIFAGVIEYIEGDTTSIQFIKESIESGKFSPKQPEKEQVIEEGDNSDLSVLNNVQKVSIKLSNGVGEIKVPSNLSEVDIKKLVFQIKILGNDFNMEETPSGNGS